MLDQHRRLSTADLELWQHFIQADHSLVSARRDLFSKSSSLVPLVKIGLERPAERAAALSIAAMLPVEKRQELLPDLLALATYVHGLTGEARRIILSLPHDWLRAHIESYAQPILERNDYEEYTGILELYSHIDRDLTLELARRAVEHNDPDIREVGEDFLSDPSPKRP